jgi:2-polyprenyl-3-methyl-5-hydroxy-6-metoxy-1,4-benzoquinol methylase
MKCRICNNKNGNKIYEVREMMFGFRDKFTYFQCSECGCLQIGEIPEDMSKYYPSNYYSFSEFSNQDSVNYVRKLIRTLRNRYAVLNKGVLGKFIYRFFPSEEWQLLSEAHLTENSAILDVGCGDGSFLCLIKEMGFKHLLGIDPYIKQDIDFNNGLKIIKKYIHEINGEWDLITFHHSFEHISDPLETLQSVSKLLTKRGVCLIRVPTVSSYAWEHYRENWVQLDAPRHFFLHSIKSMGLLAAKANLNLEKVIYDSHAIQFSGSEQYLQDIPLIEPHSIFSKAEITAFQQKAKELNSKNQGDACAFILRKN